MAIQMIHKWNTRIPTTQSRKAMAIQMIQKWDMRITQTQRYNVHHSRYHNIDNFVTAKEEINKNAGRAARN